MLKGFIAIIASLLIIKYREKIVAQTGNFAWAEKYLGGQGGTYRFFLILAVVVFFWGIASLTGTTDVFLSPLQSVFRLGGGAQQTGSEWDF